VTEYCNSYELFALYATINMPILYLFVTSLYRWMTPWVFCGWEGLWIELQSSKTVRTYFIG